MTTQIIKWSTFTIPDATVLTASTFSNTIGTVQPTTGNRWYWNAAAKEPRRDLDASGNNYIRDNMVVADSKFGMMRWFYWPGVAPPTGIQYFMVLRSEDPADSLRASMAITTAGRLRMTYNSSVQITSSDFLMTGLPAGWYACEMQGNALTSGGTMKAWLYSNDLLTTHATMSATGLVYNAVVSFGNFRYGGMALQTDWTEDRLPNGIVSMAGEPLVDNMLKDAWIASTVSPPTMVLNRVDENIVDLDASTAGAGGALTYSVTYISGADNSGGVIQLAPGIFRVPRDASASSTYRATVTETGSGLTDTEDFVVAPEAAAVATSIRRRVWTGAAWE